VPHFTSSLNFVVVREDRYTCVSTEVTHSCKLQPTLHYTFPDATEHWLL